MDPKLLEKLIDRAGQSRRPEIIFVKRVDAQVRSLGVFPSSFNPVTCAHLELMRRAADQYSLGEILALAGITNADKTSYDCPLNDRLQMLLLSLDSSAVVSVGISSSAFFVDMVPAIADSYPARTEIYFIAGLDTFERILDRENRYINRYHLRFREGSEALAYLLDRSHLIVAGRQGRGSADLSAIIGGGQLIPDAGRERILYLDWPPELGDRSASDVRERIGAGLSIKGLVPPAVERYIEQHRLYRARNR